MQVLVSVLLAALATDGAEPEVDAPPESAASTQPDTSAPPGPHTSDRYGVDGLRLVGAGDGVTLEGMLRAEGRAASPTPGGVVHTGATGPTGSTTGGSATRAVQLDGLLGTTVHQGQFSLSAAYLPRILFNVPGDTGNATNILHSGRVAASYQLSRIQTIAVEEYVSAGRQDFSALIGSQPGAPPPTTPLDPKLVSLQSAGVASSSTSVRYQQGLSPQLAATGQVGYLISGGTDAAARLQLPQQQAVHANAGVSWSLTPHDTVNLGGTASYSHFFNELPPAGASPITEDVTLGVAATWATVLAKDTQARLQFGWGAAHSTDPTSLTGWVPTVQASAGFSQGYLVERQRLALSVSVGVDAAVDRLTANIYQLAQARAGVEYLPLTVLRVSATSSGSYALSGATESGQSIAVFEIASSLTLTPRVSISAGVRGSWERQAATSGLPSGTQTAGYVTLSISDRGTL